MGCFRFGISINDETEEIKIKTEPLTNGCQPAPHRFTPPEMPVWQKTEKNHITKLKPFLNFARKPTSKTNKWKSPLK